MMFSWKERVRSWLKPTTRQVRSRTKRVLGLESLEIRDTPSITVSGAATTWSAVGPTGITGAINVQIGTDAQDIEEGAVNGVAVDPNNPAHVVIGAVNGGIWSTTNIDASSVNWTTSTDSLPSLAISTVAFSPTLANVVYAGTGSYTNGGLGANFGATVTQEGDGGGAVGLYESTDGGLTWTTLKGNSTFMPQSSTTPGLRINSLVPTSLNGGETIFASTADNSQSVMGDPSTTGLYESTDGGTSWTQLSGNNSSGLPLLPVTSIIADPGDPNRFYAAILGSGGGIYMLDTTGGNQTWENISNNLPSGVVSGADRVVLAASPAGVDPVYAAVVGPVSYGAGDGIIGVYRAVPFSPPVPTGGTPTTTYVWTAIGPNGLPPDILPGGQGQTNLGLVADPNSDSIVYVAGDRTSGLAGSNGKGSGFPGSMARGDALADTWTTVTVLPNPVPPADPGTSIPLDPSPEPTTAPHADFRFLVFDGSDKILAVSDGGVYGLANPQAKTTAPVWSSLNGNLQTTEFYSVAIANNGSSSAKTSTLYGASQDNGVEDTTSGAWSEVSLGGDGTLVLADNTNNYIYYGIDYLNQFFRKNPNGTITDLTNSPINGSGLTIGGNTNFVPAAVLNSYNPNELLIAGPPETTALLLSTDNGNTFTSIGGISGGVPANVPNVGTANSTITAVAFGTSQTTNAAYVATDDGNIAQSFDITVNNGNFTETDFQSVAGGAVATAIAMDPTNPLIAYAVTTNGVYMTTDGSDWTNITGNLFGIVNNGELTGLYSLSLFTDHSLTHTTGDYLLVGGFGGVYKLPVSDAIEGTTGWTKFGSGIPNVVVSSLFYDQQTDTLLAGTYGRGAFEITNVTADLTTTTVVVNVVGGVGSNSVAVYADTTNPADYIVTDGLGNQETFTTTAYPVVSVTLAGGATTAYVGAPGPSGTITTPPTPDLTPPLGVHVEVTGTGASDDTLVVDDTADPAPEQLTIVPQTGTTPGTIGDAPSDTLFTVGGLISFTGFDAGQIQFLLGSGADTVNIDDETTSTGAPVTAATSYTFTSAGVSRSTGGYFTFNQITQLNVTGTTGPGTYNIQSTASNLSVTGGASNDTFNLAADAPANTEPLGSLGGTLAFAGGGGSDTLNVNGTTADESITGTLTNVKGTGTLGGLPDPLSFADITHVSYNGLTGTNAFTFLDSTDVGYGSAVDPGSGMVYTPATATSGSIMLDGFTMSVAAINGGLTVNGDGTATATKDTLFFLGTSGPGLSQFGEPVIGDGRDQLTVSDSQVSISSYSAGALLGLNLATNSGAASFTTLFVETGETSDSLPDQVTVTPSTLLNLVVDGSNGGPAVGALVTIAGIGPFSVSPTSNPSYGPPQTQVTDVATAGVVGLIGFSDTSFTGVGLAGGSMSSGIIAVATQAGPLSTVQVYDRVTGDLRYTIVPFPDFHGGLSVATGDVTGDGMSDLIVGAGAGGGPLVAIFSGIDGAPMGEFYAYATSFRGGVNVSVAETPGVGHADIYTGTGPGGGPEVEEFDGQTFAQLRSAFVYESTFRGGVQVAVGDVNGDGIPDLVTSTGAGGGPEVQVLNGTNLSPIANFFAFASNTRSGFSVAVADVTGGGPDSIIVGSGPGQPAEIKVFTDLGSSVYSDFYLNSPVTAGEAPTNAGDDGVQVAAADINGDGIPDILAVEGPGAAPFLHAYQVSAMIPPTNAVTPILSEIRTQAVMSGTAYTGLTVAGSD